MTTIKALLVSVAAALLVAPGLGQTFHVQQDLTPFASTGGQLAGIGFQLSDGALAGDGSTKVTLSNFSSNGVTFGSVSPPLGNAVRQSNGDIDLVDGFGVGNEIADYSFNFYVLEPVAQLSFDLTITGGALDAGTPDYFFMYLLNNGALLHTDGPFGIEMVSLDISSQATEGRAYTVDGSLSGSAFGGLTTVLSASSGGGGSTGGGGTGGGGGGGGGGPVPEPITMLVVAAGLVGLHKKHSRR